MALPLLATVEDIETRLGRPVADAFQTESLIAYASALVRAATHCTFVDSEGDLIDPLPNGVNEVVVGMIERAATNTSGVTQEVTGPFSVSFGSDAAQRVYLTKGDKTILAAIACRSPLGVISTTRGPVETPNGPRWDAVDDDISEIAG